MEEVDLNNFQVVSNENGVVFIDKTNVMLQNSTTGEVLATAFDNVSSFYGLESQTLAEPMTPVNDKYQEYSPETIIKEAPDESSEDEFQTLEEKPNVAYRPPMKWGMSETKFMLKLYTSLIHSVGAGRRFRTKKLMWGNIAAQLQRKFKITSLTGKQVESRYKCLSKRIKKPTLINAKKIERREIVYGRKIFANVEQDDPIGIDTVMSQGRIFVVPRKPVVRVPPPDPSTLLKMIPTPAEQDEEIFEGETSNPVRRNRRAPQVAMFERYLEQKAKFFEERETKRDERARQKAEMEKQKQKLKQQKEEKKLDREKQKELMKQQRHLEKMQLLKDILNKSLST